MPRRKSPVESSEEENIEEGERSEGEEIEGFEEEGEHSETLEEGEEGQEPARVDDESSADSSSESENEKPTKKQLARKQGRQFVRDLVATPFEQRLLGDFGNAPPLPKRKKGTAPKRDAKRVQKQTDKTIAKKNPNLYTALVDTFARYGSLYPTDLPAWNNQLSAIITGKESQCLVKAATDICASGERLESIVDFILNKNEDVPPKGVGDPPITIVELLNAIKHRYLKYRTEFGTNNGHYKKSIKRVAELRTVLAEASKNISFEAKRDINSINSDLNKAIKNIAAQLKITKAEINKQSTGKSRKKIGVNKAKKRDKAIRQADDDIAQLEQQASDDIYAIQREALQNDSNGIRLLTLLDKAEQTVRASKKYLKKIDEGYIHDLQKILDWALSNNARLTGVPILDTIFPEDKLIPAVQTYLEKPKFRDDAALRKKTSEYIRRHAIKLQIFEMVDLDILRNRSLGNDSEKTAERLYRGNLGDKAKANLTLSRYDVESRQLHRVMYRMIDVRRNVRFLTNEKFLEECTGETEEEIEAGRCKILDESSEKLYLSRQREFADMFHDYQFEFRQHMAELLQSEQIPSPMAQSTYELTGIDTDLCNLLMWPDRYAVSLDPVTSRFNGPEELTVGLGEPNAESMGRESSIKLRCQILNEYLDPWYWFQYRQNFTKLKNKTFSSMIRNILDTQISLILNGDENAINFTYIPGDNHVDEDRDLILKSTRNVNLDFKQGPSPILRNKKKITVIRKSLEFFTSRRMQGNPGFAEEYLKKYLQRINSFSSESGSGITINELTPEEFPERIIEGEYVYTGESHFEVNDILKTTSESIGELETRPSEFTIYMLELEKKSGGNLTLGSFITFKEDISPHILTYRPLKQVAATETEREPIILNETMAGHVFKLEFQSSSKDKGNIWYKNVMYKVEGRKEKDTKIGWCPKVIDVDVICDQSKSYEFDTFPEWMILMFKLLASVIYKHQKAGDADQFVVMLRLDKLKRFGKVPENLLIYFLKKYLDFGLFLDARLVATSEKQVATESFYLSSLFDADGNNLAFDHDYLVQDIHKIYTRPVVEEVSGDILSIATNGNYYEEVDPTEPFLMRPLPTRQELWKLWQGYNKDLNGRLFGIDPFIDIKEHVAEKKKTEKKHGYRTSQIKSSILAFTTPFNKIFKLKTIAKLARDNLLIPVEAQENEEEEHSTELGAGENEPIFEEEGEEIFSDEEGSSEEELQ